VRKAVTKSGEVHPIRPGIDASYEAPRRLAAILAADIAGYSRLMTLDEEGTHARVKRYRRELIEPAIVEHHGRLIKTTGDGFLAMFDSPVEAVRCAIVVQQSMVGRNAALPRDQWMQYRIGVNLGDVIVEPDDIYGDGVNIAARLEGIAKPGEVYISGGVYEQIKNKLVCGYQLLGNRKVKNITEPISVYRVLPDHATLVRARSGRTLAIILSVSAFASVAVAPAAWYFFASQPKQSAATQERAPPQTANASKSDSASALQSAAPQVAVIRPAPPSSAQPTVEPEMVTLLGGKFAMGSNNDPSERPIHQVDIKPFALSKFPITVGQWKQCVAANACVGGVTGDDDDAPVTNVSWSDTQKYTEWLSQVTQKTFRLPSEAEWEYAARGGVHTKYWWGDQIQPGMVNCNGCNEAYDAVKPTKVGSFKPNPFGLYDMGGGVDQWVADCWHKNYQGAPVDGSPWLDADCSSHVLRSGSWRSDPNYVRPSSRNYYDTNARNQTLGFRVAQSL
jgi:formylglycine-generating enzyme required for sulfatase activity/class 3 adenylate cyclase